MTEVWKADYYLVANTEQGFDEGLWFIDLLQGLAEDDIVEGVIGVVSDLFVDVAVDDGEALGDALLDIVLTEIDAGAGSALLIPEQAQEFSVATTQIKHLGIRSDPGGDDFEIKTHQGWYSLVMRSRNPLNISAKRGFGNRNAS